MLKVAKFGGSSMADAKQFEKVREIVTLLAKNLTLLLGACTINK